jgi:hypothetical protein
MVDFAWNMVYAKKPEDLHTRPADALQAGNCPGKATGEIHFFSTTGAQHCG